MATPATIPSVDELTCWCGEVKQNRAGLKAHQRAIHGGYEVPDDHGAGRPPAPDWMMDPGDDAKPRPVEQPTPASPYETAPTAKRPGFFRRIVGRGKAAAGVAPGPSDRPKERVPKRTAGRGKRVPLDQDISDLWAEIGSQLEHTPHYPTGRMLQYQALGAGVMLDRALAGTLPDRLILQPIARQKDKWEDVFDLLAPPMLTFAITNSIMRRNAAMAKAASDPTNAAAHMEEAQRHEASARALGRTFDFCTRRMLVRIAPAIKKARQRQEEQAEAIKEAFPELAGTDIDPVDLFRTMLWAPPGEFDMDHHPEGSPNGTGEPVSSAA